MAHFDQNTQHQSNNNLSEFYYAAKKADISTYVVGTSVNLHDQHALHFMLKIGVNTGKLSMGDLISRESGKTKNIFVFPL